MRARGWTAQDEPRALALEARSKPNRAGVNGQPGEPVRGALPFRCFDVCGGAMWGGGGLSLSRVLPMPSLLVRAKQLTGGGAPAGTGLRYFGFLAENDVWQ
eukprot:COSAG01_NODE_277_length_19582_cov_28.126726_10_plen_101_part_00